jgi:hypothetical protein
LTEVLICGRNLAGTPEEILLEIQHMPDRCVFTLLSNILKSIKHQTAKNNYNDVRLVSFYDFFLFTNHLMLTCCGDS